MSAREKKMKRLLIDAKAITNNMDGLGYYSLFFTRRLISFFRNKFKIFVVLPPSAKGIRLFDPWEMQHIKIVFSRQERFSCNYEFNFQEWDTFVASLKPDIYISTAFCATNYHCKNVVVIHDLAPIIFSGRFRSEKVKFYTRLINGAINNSDLIIAASNYTATSIRAKFPDHILNIKVLYPDLIALINRMKLNLKIPIQEHRRFLVVGVKCPRKNIELVINSLKLLKERNIPSCKVFFVGNLREYDVPLRKLILQNSLEDVTSILGYVSDEEKRQLIYGSVGLIFPSQNEGFGIPLIEFLAANKPIICTRTSSIPEIIGNLGYFSENNPYAFAGTMLQVYHQNSHFPNQLDVDRRLRKLVSINEAQFHSVFTWIAQCITLSD